MRDLTIGDQRMLAQILRSQNPLVHSDNLAPVDVNILPMQLVVDTETVDSCITAVQKHLGLIAPTLAREIVLSVLKAAMDIGRGRTEHSESKIGGDAT